ncbi:hypothetical protein SRB5_71100 [Streptomyces sp. RB5]|uniref:Holo-[acyl-carrier-protein] synthase n=2 Tax=Streptomyces smaragdinus TaxID=2585196 RepID=A0A7K0CTU7_9ACTN|nr:hypothetical protein [Streptomyces smaragdinus]
MTASKDLKKVGEEKIGGLHWHDAEVCAEKDGRPFLRVRGTVAARAAELGVRHWHVSLSHDAGVASAVVIAEG